MDVPIGEVDKPVWFVHLCKYLESPQEGKDSCELVATGLAFFLLFPNKLFILWLTINNRLTVVFAGLESRAEITFSFLVVLAPGFGKLACSSVIC
jgi:hypothetical protein